jgi:hypothetical protein
MQVRMAGFIAAKRAEAAAELAKLRQGGGNDTHANPAPPAAPAANDCPGAHVTPAAPDCGGCATAGGTTAGAPAAGGTAAGGTSGPGGAAAPAGAANAPAPGLDRQVSDEVTFAERRADPDAHFRDPLQTARDNAQTALGERAVKVARAFEGGFAGTVDETGAVAALRGMTFNQGRALDVTVYPGRYGGRLLETDLQHYLDDDPTEYAAAHAYLWGDNVTGARIELNDSLGFFNDDEARIEDVMRALSPEQLAALGRAAPDTIDRVRDALGGTDLQVFDALRAGDYALADAYRMRDAVNEARRDGDADATHRAIEQWTGAPREGDWRAAQEVEADERRTAVIDALGGIVSDADVARGLEPGQRLEGLSTADRAVAFVVRDVDVYVGGAGPEGEPQTVTLRMGGANRDLARALMTQRDDSVEVRAARLGVELQRRGERPNPINIDRATFDPRFRTDAALANPNTTDAEREAHRRAAEDRARAVMLAAQRYAGGEPAPADWAPASDPEHRENLTAAMNEPRVLEARNRLIAGLRDRFGSDTLGADLAAGLLTDARPSPATAARAMRYAQRGWGTNEEMLFRFTERMDRDEIAAMRNEYRSQTGGSSLEADLGVYGEGGFGEVSGDDRLRMERALLGAPRNDRERLEVAAFAIEQQRRESSGFGAWLAEGSLAAEGMASMERDLRALAGGPIGFNRRGEVIGLAASRNFDPATGRYVGADHASFAATVNTAQAVADAYSARIDAFADVATTAIAILGAVAAAVITVATGGAAGPLIVAALVTGLASMSAQYAIKGGRYGWEQAALDLGMTAVQAVTAGVGAQLGAAAQVASKGAAAASTASRTIAGLSRIFTGNRVVDQIIVGAITGGISGLGTTALDERTWDKSGGDAVLALFGGLLKGSLGGAATATVTNGIEAVARQGAAVREAAIRLGNRPGLLTRGLGAVDDILNAGVGGGRLRSGGVMLGRGLARGGIQSLGAMAGRSTEIAFDRARGRLRGDWGSAWGEIGAAGLQALIQGVGEGAGEAVGQRIHARSVEAAAQRINGEREGMGLRPLEGRALTEAAGDLVFLDTHGAHHGLRGPLGSALNVEHIARHGGMAATVVTRTPEPPVVDAMRAALLRHVPPTLHGQFADLPLRVLPAAEYQALTRSVHGPVATLIENGRPVVVVREGTEIPRLADEGPHLVQSQEAGTRERVARLDEATLARWDSLDLDTQLALYDTKIGLEIDAHQRIQSALEAAHEAALPRRPAEAERLATEIERNAVTLRNLQARADEVAAIGPQRRGAIAEGQESRPQYLDQPARLFSKEGRPTDAARLMAETIAEIERMVPARHRGTAEDEPPTPALRPPEGHPEGDRSGRLFNQTPEQITEHQDRRERGNTFNRERAAAYPHGEVTLEAVPGERGRVRVDALAIGELATDATGRRVVVGAEIVERKFSQLAEIGVEAAIDRINELTDLYHPGAEIADVRPRRGEVSPTAEAMAASRATLGPELGGRLHGQMVLEIPQQLAPVPRAVLEHAQRNGVILRDPDGRVYSLAHPDGDDGVRRITPNDPDDRPAELQAALLRHVPPDQHAALAEVTIHVLPAAEYLALTQSRRGPVVTLIEGGQAIVVIREGTPIARLADEGPHLAQLHDAATAARVRRLDEATLARWHELPLETQLELYRTKIELEIDAQQRILRSAEAEARAAADADGLARARVAAERAEDTARALAARLAEVDAITPARRAAIEAGGERRPQYLEQPARLFSKDASVARAASPRERVFEPFAGPDLSSARELQARHPGAEVVTAEASHPPTAAEIAAFEAAGGRFLAERFGQSLPDASVDRLHVRFPLPHEKGQELVLHPPMLRPDATPAERVAALQRLEQEARARQSAVESLTNLGPHALRLLRPGGEIELVFHEGSIAREAGRLGTLEWVDPATGQRWRLQAVGEAQVVPRSVAPHSGFGIPESVTEVNRLVLRKVRVVTEAERIEGRRQRAERRATERAERQERSERRERERTEAAEREERQAGARGARDEAVEHERAERQRALDEGRLTPEEDLRQRLAAVADQIDLPPGQVARLARAFVEQLGGGGRRIDAQEVIDSLRNRVREGRPPRWGDLDNVAAELIVEQNAVAVAMMREHIGAVRPDAVLGVERGGAFLAEVLAHGAAPGEFPPTVAVPKSVTAREGQPDLVQRIPRLEAEIRRRVAAGQSRFAIVDFYMGGVFAREVQAMIASLVADHPHLSFEVMWMRETHGFERVVFHPERPRPERPTAADLAQGVSMTGRVRLVPTGDAPGRLPYRLVIEEPSRAVIVPPLAGAERGLPQMRATAWPVEMVLGDDMRAVLDRSPTEPVRIIDRSGRVVREIPPGTPDPVTGEPLPDTRAIMVRLMEGFRFDGRTPGRGGAR